MIRSPKRARVGLRTKIIGLLLGVLLVFTAAYVSYAYVDQRNRMTGELLEKSRVLVLEMDAVWDFVSINQNIINYTSDGEYDYKGLHCAIAGKSVAALFNEASDYSYIMRFVNFNPRNIYNTPDAYEQRALADFKANPSIEERYGFEEIDGEQVFRYVSAMEVDSSCVECHGGPAGEIDPTGYPKEGWEVGDVAGAVSVIVPAEEALSSMRSSFAANVLMFLALVVCVGVVVYRVLSHLVTNPLTKLSDSFVEMGDDTHLPLMGERSEREERGEYYASREVDDLFRQFDDMACKLSQYYADLELQVSERTAQLSQANEELERQRAHVEEVNAQLERDNRYKSDFLAIVSHELRTPLTSIIAFTELLSESIDPDDTVSLRQLQEVEKNGMVLLEMVDNVLETARIQAGSERLNLELVDLNDVVGMVVASNEPVALRKGVEMTSAVSSGVPLIMSDWEKLRRILTNLVSNAVKFTPTGGNVTVDVSFDGDRRMVRMAVEDTGIGIPHDKQDLVFERFTQENMSTVRRYGGSGLGLSLVKDLVAMLGGCVELTSEPGVGSTFVVYLPAEDEEELA